MLKEAFCAGCLAKATLELLEDLFAIEKLAPVGLFDTDRDLGPELVGRQAEG